MANIDKFFKLQQQKNWIWPLVKKFRAKFRTPENINNDSEEALKEAKRKFIKFSFLGGTIERVL